MVKKTPSKTYKEEKTQCFT